jgi:formylglycine-generating enzyme required for sulfatase activity
LLDREQVEAIRYTLLLALGEFDRDRLPLSERELSILKLEGMYRNDPDSGIHGAAGCLLRRWGKQKLLAEIDETNRGQKPPKGQRWYVNGQGQTMVIVPQSKDWFEMGEDDEKHRRRISRSFAISAREVTLAEFRLSRLEHEHSDKVGDKPECPVNGVSWYDAAAYCNWLSKKEGIPEKEWCYLGKGENIRPVPDYLKRLGYRLPTEAEWEYACRAGSTTGWSHGEAAELLERYAWYFRNSVKMKTSPVGLLRPNGLGLFDMHGNV